MTERVGLLGWPVEHSVSAAMHNAAFAALGLDWRYDLLPVRPAELGTRLPELIEAGYHGFNVTVPHKRAVLALPQVTEAREAVRALGAANTLTRRPDNTLAADNTDLTGFMDDLHAQGIDPSDRRCLVLGTGGSAQAVRAALYQMGAARVTMVSRQPGGQEGVIGYDELAALTSATGDRASSSLPPTRGKAAEGRKGAGSANPTSENTLIINCTPVGMWPRVDASPWPEGVPFPPGAILYDLVYNPPVTRLMAQARQAGGTASGGLGMLVRQGAAAFNIWTNQQAPVSVMAEAAKYALTELTQRDISKEH